MPKGIRRKTLALLLSLFLTASLALAIAPTPAAAATPNVTVTVLPGMVSIWGLGLLPAPNFDAGPGHATIIVKGVDAPDTATVTLNLTTLFNSLFPTAASRVQLFPAKIQAGYNAKMAELAAIEFEWDDDLEAWVHELGTEEEINEPAETVQVVAEAVLFQDAALGAKTLPITITNSGGGLNSGTINGGVTVVDMQRPVLPGWNAISTPAALGNPNWAAIKALNNAAISEAVYFDARFQQWRTFGTSINRTLNPMDAVYVKASDFTTLGLIFSRARTEPPSASLRNGWNLVSPAVVERSGAYFQVPVGDFLGPLGTALSTVISAGEAWTYTQHFEFQGVEVGSHQWGFAQPNGVYWDDPMVVGGGYWVFLDLRAAGLPVGMPVVLPGLSTTPLRFAGWDPF